MKKSPFSTPRGGNSGRQGFGWNSTSPGRGNGRAKNYEIYSPNQSQTGQSQSLGEDFIPFDRTPPSNQRKSSDNWQSPRGQWSGGGRGPRRQSSSPGYTNYRENRAGNNYQAPYFTDNSRQFWGQRKNYQRDNTRKKSDISQYMNLSSFLEDPWLKLCKKSDNDVSVGESQNESSTDLSVSTSVLGKVGLEDSVNEDAKGREVSNDSLEGSDSSFVHTSFERLDTSVCLESRQSPELSQDSND